MAEDLLAKYLRTLEADNLSPLTLRNYATDLRAFFRHLEEREGAAITAVDRLVLRRYLAELRAEGMAVASIVRKVSTIRSFYRFLAREGRVAQDPLLGVRGPKKGRRLPSFLTRAQVLNILAAVQGDEPKDLRDRKSVV